MMFGKKSLSLLPSVRGNPSVKSTNNQRSDSHANGFADQPNTVKSVETTTTTEAPSRKKRKSKFRFWILASVVTVSLAWFLEVVFFYSPLTVLGKEGTIEDGSSSSSKKQKSQQPASQQQQPQRSTPFWFQQHFDQEAAYLMDQVYPAAKSNNYKCDEATTFPTAVNYTAEHFSDIRPQRHNYENNNALSDGYFTPVDFIFQAYSAQNTTPQENGGDTFVVVFIGGQKLETKNNNNESLPLTSSSSSLPTASWTIFKTATFAKDLLNGTYVATLHLPPGIHRDSIKMSLYHHNTCWEGWTPVISFLKEVPNILLAPQRIHPHEALRDLVSIGVSSPGCDNDTGDIAGVVALKSKKNDAASEDEDIFSFHRSLPPCEASQNGADAMTMGVWVEQTNLPEPPFETSLDAIWMPLTCRPPPISLEDAIRTKTRFFRMGDSMMPNYLHGKKVKKFHQSNPFVPHRTDRSFFQWYHRYWLNTLGGTIPNDPDMREGTYLIFEGGLHQLFKGQTNARTTVDELLHMFCQLALVYPGRLQLVGPPPIQQHMHPSFDILSQNVRFVNAHLRLRVQQAEYQVYNLCHDAPIGSFFSVSDVQRSGFEDLNGHKRGEGNVLPHNEGVALFNWTEKEKHLETIRRFRNFTLEDRRLLYGNRSVILSDLEAFLLPRMEMYKARDKIHDTREVLPTNLSLWETGHSEVIAQLQHIRMQMGIP